jgi:radical SAM superfamily enzyme YgiQ (UPF0313 family)
MMNRAHNSSEARKCLEIATQYFDNISLDLIYGIPGMSNEKWKQNSIYKSSIREHRHTKSIVFCPFKGNKK